MASPEIETLTQALSRLPGLGPRSARRAVLHLLCGFDIAQLWSFDLPYGSLLSLRVWPGPKTVAQITGLRQ